MGLRPEPSYQTESAPGPLGSLPTDEGVGWHSRALPLLPVLAQRSSRIRAALLGSFQVAPVHTPRLWCLFMWNVPWGLLGAVCIRRGLILLIAQVAGGCLFPWDSLFGLWDGGALPRMSETSPFGGPAILTTPHAHLGVPGTCPTPRLGTGSTSFPLSTSHSLAFSEKLNQEMEGTLETLISQGHLDSGLDLIPAPWRPRWKDHLISGVQDQLVTWQDLHLHFNFSKKGLRKNKILVGCSAGLRIQAKAQPALHAGPQPPRGPQAAPSPHSGQEG